MAMMTRKANVESEYGLMYSVTARSSEATGSHAFTLEAGNVDFSVASADDLSAFKPKSFDAVSMSYVLMLLGPEH